MKTRRIGTLTLGGGLVVFGCLFLVHIFFNSISYLWIFRLWPVLLISLGVEMLWGNIQTENQWKLDAGAIVLLFLLTGFAMAMAAADFLLQAGMMHFGGMTP